MSYKIETENIGCRRLTHISIYFENDDFLYCYSEDDGLTIGEFKTRLKNIIMNEYHNDIDNYRYRYLRFIFNYPCLNGRVSTVTEWKEPDNTYISKFGKDANKAFTEQAVHDFCNQIVDDIKTETSKMSPKELARYMITGPDGRRAFSNIMESALCQGEIIFTAIGSSIRREFLRLPKTEEEKHPNKRATRSFLKNTIKDMYGKRKRLTCDWYHFY